MELKKMRVFWLTDDQKEEAWLNQMSDSGWQLKKVWGPFYTFDQSSQKYTYRLDVVALGQKQEETEAYLAFMKEMEAEQVGRYINWYYFRKKRSDGPFELYSNLDSRLAYLDRVRKHAIVSLCLFIPILLLWGSSLFWHWGTDQKPLVLRGLAILLTIALLLFCIFVGSLLVKLNKRIAELRRQRRLQE